MSRARLVLAALAAALVALSVTAAPAAAGEVLQRAINALRSDPPVYVDAGAGVVPADALSQLRAAAENSQTPLYVAVISSDPDYRSGGEAVRELARGVGRDGTYLIMTQRGLYPFSTVLSPGQVRSAFTGVNTSNVATPEQRAAVLLEVVRGIADAPAPSGLTRTDGSGDEGGSGPGGGLVLVGVALLAALGLFAWGRSRKRRREREEAAAFEEVRGTAEEDVTLLGEDISRLDLDVDGPGVDDATRADYAHALNAYDRAKAALEAARRPEDLQQVTVALEDGRYAMECVRARLAGRPLPERRPPCFFNPQHGPSVRDVHWAPPGGAPRLVPACAADAEAVEHGLQPHSREVVVGGERRPYWDAGPMYAPWAGGYYAGYGMGGILPGILIGTMLGSAMAGPGWGYGYGAGDSGGESGGADAGDGDWGGGDFGGGDFGGGWGGGDFGGSGDFGGGGDGGW